MWRQFSDFEFGAAASWLLHHWANQLGGTFLAPGSTLSFAALACTLAAALIAIAPARRKVGIRILFRSLFPDWLIKSPSGKVDIAYFLFSTLLSGIAFGWALLSADGIGRSVAELLGRLHGSFNIAPAPSAATTIALTLGGFLVYEFAYWLDHYLSHRVAILWRFHAVHHSAERLSLLTNFRVHPVDTIIFYNIVALCLGTFFGVAEWLCGPAPRPFSIGGTNVLIMVSAVFVTHLQHSHLWVTFGRLGGGHILGPAHHQIHHSADAAHFDKNFGSTLALWDRIFGTFCMPPAQRPKLRFGVDRPGFDPHSFCGTLIDPMMAIRPPRPLAFSESADARAEQL